MVPPVTFLAIAMAISRLLILTTDSSVAIALEIVRRQADPGHAVDERDRGRGHALAGQDGLELPGRVQIAWPRQAVRDDRGFERDDGRAGAQSGADRRGYLYQGRHANDCLTGGASAGQ